MYFLHFRNAQSPCNEEYKHESAIAHTSTHTPAHTQAHTR